MILDKPSWIRHGDANKPDSIYSIDAHSDGTRLATAGGDGKVIIWSVKYINSHFKKGAAHAKGGNGIGNGKGKSGASASREVEKLATLVDHKGPANVVRFSCGGRFIATGGDDRLVLVHELRPGPGNQRSGGFGAGRIVNLENWVLSMTFAGHSNNVVDLAWSPDDNMLASCSLDNTVRIWDTVRGNLVTVIQDHDSFVKGVVWDPVGKYMASQSDDKSVIVRTVDGWEPVKRIKEPFVKGALNTFSTRLDWSPEGSHLVAGNAYNNPKYTATILPRGQWSKSQKERLDYVGHQSPVVCCRFNPRVFRITKEDTATGKSVPLIAPCVAMGGQDRMVSVWLTQKERPVMVGKHFFKQSVIDLTWAPDGLTLYAASIDGSVAVFKFQESEIGKRMPTREVQETMTKSYGTAKAHLSIAEDPALMMLQDAAPIPSGPTATPSSQDHAMASPTKSTPTPTPTHAPTHAHASAPAAQRKTVTADGRVRIAPVPLGAGGGGAAPIRPHTNGVGGGAGGNGAANGIAAPRAAARDRAAATPPPQSPAKRKGGAGGINGHAGPGKIPKRSGAAQAGGGGGRAGAGAGAAGVGVAAAAPAVVIAGPPARERLSASVGPSTILDAHNVERKGLEGVLSRWTELVCVAGQKHVWTDKHLGMTARLAAGCEGYAAVAFQGGVLQVYSRSGRRAWPPLSLGADLAFLEMKLCRPRGASGPQMVLLLAVTTEGCLRVWDVEACRAGLRSDVAPVARAQGAGRVRSVRLTATGAPLVVLDNRHALVHSAPLDAWSLVASGNHLHSEYNSAIIASRGRDDDSVHALNAEAAVHETTHISGMARQLMHVTAGEQRRSTSRHLETLVQAARELRSDREYRRYLSLLVREWSIDGDEAKLRCLIKDLIGGEDGAHKALVKELVLPTIVNANRSMQRLASEYLDIMTSMV